MFRSSPTNHGVTVPELIVVLAVLATLVGAVVPLWRGVLMERRVERAKQDVDAIADAIATFRKTVGVWPAMDASGANDSLAVLLSGPRIPALDPWSGSTRYWAIAAGSRGDLLNHHLVENRPKGQSTHRYPVHAKRAWCGPYLDACGVDPWGRPYLVNVLAAYSSAATTDRRLWVLSAGPDGRFQTSSLARTADRVAGDDIGSLVWQR